MPNMRVRLILTTHDSSSGCLKAARMADRVLNVSLQNLCVGPVPLARDAVAVLADRALLAAEPYSDWAMPYAADLWREADAACRLYERVEIWVEPHPNAQVHLLCLLDRLGRSPAIAEKLFINHFDSVIGKHTPEAIRARKHVMEAVQPEMLTLASAAWNAFRQPMPEAWFALLDRDLSAFPHLEQTVLRLLAELPAADNGLSLSERIILDLAARQPIAVEAIFKREGRLQPDQVLDFHGLGWTLERLAGAGLVEGLERGFDGPGDWYKTYFKAELSLTAHGRAILDGRAELEVDRWWGGTHLTGDSPWRWDEANRTLLANRAQPS